MSQLESEGKKALSIKNCPECGLELAGENAICACDPNFIFPEPVDPMIGETFGCYKILEAVGRGGMGIIYKAQDQWMDRTIAIKMLHQHLVHDLQSQQRFNQEAKAYGNIEHPNVIQAYDCGVVPTTQQPFLVMEFLEGKTLAQMLDNERGEDKTRTNFGNVIEPERAVNIFIQVADALRAAHARNVLHRDLKPSNIMLIKTRDGEDFVKVVDFGIAKLLPASGKDAQLTQTGEIFGSPLYMSPEQFQGQSLDVRSDIYSLGCVMYEALLGKPPLAGEHVLETMYKHIKDKPKRFAEVRPDLKISPKIESVVMRALEKEPDQRYQTMAELRDDLMLTRAGFKDRRPLHVKFKAKMAHLRRIRKRYEELAGKALLVVLTMIVSAAAVRFAIGYFRANQEGEWRALKTEAQNYYSREDFKNAAEKLKQAANVAQREFGQDDPRFLETLKHLAWVYNADAYFNDSEEGYRKGRTLFESVYKLSNEELEKIKMAQTLLASRDLMMQMAQGGSPMLVEEGLRKAIETIEKYLGSNDPELIPLLEDLAGIYQIQHNFQDADDLYMQIFSIMEDTEGATSVGAAYANKLLGGLHMDWGNHLTAEGKREEANEKFKQAHEFFSKAYNQYKQILGSESPQAKDALLLLEGKKQPENLGKPLRPTDEKTIPEF